MRASTEQSKKLIPKIHILYEFKSGPWGGGNQFLKALRIALTQKGVYAETLDDSDVVLFNSHHFGDGLEQLKLLIELKKSRPDLRLMHRLDGPVSLIRGGSKSVDELIFHINARLADGTVFQTDWSRKKSAEMGLVTPHSYRIINNAPDKNLFYPKVKKRQLNKIKLINSAWAANKRKGLDILHYLDRELDFERFEMTFVGNVKSAFQNIITLPPQNSESLAKMLRAHDIFIAPSINDPCSNALCEALHSGLPSLVRNSGGHPELLLDGGLTFEDKGDILDKLEELVHSYNGYRSNIRTQSINEIADQYLSFAAELMTQDPYYENINISYVRMRLKMYAFKDRVKNAIIRRMKWNHS